jgi:hypothetical protein
MTPITSRMDPRLDSPGQLALVALGLWIVGSIVPFVHILAPLGLLLLLGAGVAYLLRPRRHTMYWRGRTIELDGEPTATARLYRAIFKR